MVSNAGQTLVESPRVSFWSGVDLPLRVNGNGSLDHLAVPRFQKCSHSLDAIRMPAGPECGLVVDLLRTPSTGWACVEIVILWLAILATAVTFFRHSQLAAALLLPYLAWVSFATILNFTIWSLNATPT